MPADPSATADFYGNADQKAAITYGSGPLLVLAGPGSGKTFTITRRIQFLIEQAGADPSSILVITFTRAAAQQMKERFHKLTGGRPYPVNFGTFHAIYYHILKTSFHFKSNALLTEYEKRERLKIILSQPAYRLEQDDDVIEGILSQIGEVKNRGCKPEQYTSTVVEQDIFCDLFHEYEHNNEHEGRLDFEDMVLKCGELLLGNPQVLNAWQEKFCYILIDEFQDINPKQYEVIRLLAYPQNNLFVVGDDDQSIYAFRGASPSIMLGFNTDYPGAGRVLLGTNYRSTSVIVNAAQKLITQNTLRFPKKLTAEKDGGKPVQYRGYIDREEEYGWLAEELKRKLDHNASETAAVIFRTNQDAVRLSEILLQHNIPFVIRDKIKSPYRRMPAMDLMAYLTFALEERRRSDFLRIMNKPLRYIGRNALDSETVSLKALYSFYLGKEYMKPVLRKLELDLERIRRMDLYAGVNYIRKGIGYDSFLRKYALENRKEAKELLDMAQQFQDGVRGFTDLETFREYVKCYEAALERTGNGHESGNRIQLISMHSSKGLEFDRVYLPDCNEGVTPHRKSMQGKEAEEERRVFYVAMTRAKRELTLMFVRGTQESPGFLSRFLYELTGRTDL